MLAFILAAALGGWGQSGGCPGGVCPMPSSGMPYFVQPQPQWVQIQGPVVQPQTPPASLQSVTGKVVGLEVVGPDGRRLFYPFAGDLTVTLKYDPATSVVSEASLPPGKDVAKAQGCANPDCCCDPCKCKDCKCPKTPEPQPLQFEQQPTDSIPNYGLDQKKMAERQGRLRYSTNGGREITKYESNKLLGADGLPDDSTQMFLTVIGTEAEQNAVRAVVKANPKVFEKIRCKYYAPTDDMVKNKGFVAGTPSIYLESATGKTEYRFESMPTDENLVAEVDKRRPDYDPNKDPRPNKPQPTPIGPTPIDFSKIPGWVIAIGGFLLAAFLKQPSK